jgi:hypothetical protein
VTGKALDVDISVGYALAPLSQLNALRGQGGWEVLVLLILLRLPLLLPCYYRVLFQRWIGATATDDCSYCRLLLLLFSFSMRLPVTAS